MKLFLARRGLISLLLLATVIPSVAQKSSANSKLIAKAPAAIVLAVDATETPRKIFHAKMIIPTHAGTLTLYYPKWMPGEHGPTGPIQDLAGLKFTANGQTLAWRRDLLDGWTFHVEVPTGVTSVEANLDFISPAGGQGAYTAGASATDKMTILNWNTVLLYPAGWTADDLNFEASLTLPEGWKFGTALPVASQSGSTIKFKPVSLTTLIDSPVNAGQYMRVVQLAPNPPEELDIVADSPSALDVPIEVFTPYRSLVDQAQRLFGAQHFTEYHFLYSLSDYVAHFGLEHHQSNDSRLGERYLVDPDLRMLGAGLLPHEYLHSWNGKYRRPVGLATPDYQKPMQDDLLWVYEGLTSYLGDVLSGRSGLRTPEQYRNNLARIAAQLDHRPSRIWRNLQDTADGVPAMQGAPHQWESWRRALDYYDEDVLNWLWVDTIIRQQTQGAKSIDDFCHLFHGGQNSPPAVKSYTLDDVVNTLDQVVSYDWRGFWSERLTNHGPGAPLTGVENSGWKLVYDEKKTPLIAEWEEQRKQIDASNSVGLLLDWNGTVVDTIEGMPAAKAGIGPGMKIVAVNGKKMTRQVFHDALKATKNSSELLQFLVENTDYYKTYKVEYQGGEKYPHLVRDDAKPDMLSDIIKAK
jgi:predicted metalloprotease with PDZ domain